LPTQYDVSACSSWNFHDRFAGGARKKRAEEFALQSDCVNLIDSQGTARVRHVRDAPAAQQQRRVTHSIAFFFPVIGIKLLYFHCETQTVSAFFHRCLNGSRLLIVIASLMA
jgi:hypothetical protein